VSLKGKLRRGAPQVIMMRALRTLMMEGGAPDKNERELWGGPKWFIISIKAPYSSSSFGNCVLCNTFKGRTKKRPNSHKKRNCSCKHIPLETYNKKQGQMISNLESQLIKQ